MENVLVEYSYSPSITGVLRSVDICIYENFDFKFEIFYYKKPDKTLSDEEYYRSARRYKKLKDKFPAAIQSNIKRLLSFESFEIKRTYPELTNEERMRYEPSDIGNEFYTFYIYGEKYSINVNPWYFNKDLLKTEQELFFLEFHKSILDWIDETHNTLIKQED